MSVMCSSRRSMTSTVPASKTSSREAIGRTSRISPVTLLIVMAWLARKMQEIESKSRGASIRRRRVVDAFIEDADELGGERCMTNDIKCGVVLLGRSGFARSEQGTKALSEEHTVPSTQDAHS